MSLAIQSKQQSLTLLRGGGVLAVYFLLSFIVTQLSFGFSPNGVVTLLYPAAALDITLLLIFGWRWLPAVFVAPVVGALLRAAVGLDSFALLDPEPIVNGLASGVAYGVGAYLLRHVAKINVRLTRLYDISWLLLIGSTIAPLIAALVGVLGFVASGLIAPNLWLESVLTLWAGDATGVAMLAPLILTHQHWSGVRLARPPEERTVDARVAYWIGLGLILTTAWLAYGVTLPFTLDISYLVFVPLIWVATRGGFRRTTIAVFVLNSAVLIFVQTGFTDPQVIALQFNLMTVSYVSLLLASVFTAYRRSRAKLQYSVYHDRLTDLPNRSKLMDLLSDLDKKRSTHYALLFINLDRFKLINDTYGHTIGDAFLMLVGQRLQSCLEPKDVLARLGGDEFAILLPEISSLKRVMALAEQVSAQLEHPTEVKGYQVVTKASIGVATARTRDPEGLNILQKADTAMREAKAVKASYIMFDDSMKERISERIDLERDLRLALEKGELEVHFQPIVSLTSGGITGHEALMRWNKGKSGYVPPLSFIPIAEETGLIHELSEWLMKQVMIEGPSEGYIAINLSVQQLQHLGFVGRIRTVLEETDFPAERLVFEVTESIMMVDLNASVAVLSALAKLGAKVAMDDFGTGYASLSYLKRLPIHILKIDRSFLHGVPEDAEDVSLVRTILSMAKSLNLGVVAEGVETEAQAAFLREHNCEQVQGFLYGRPLPLRRGEVSLRAPQDVFKSLTE